MNAYIHIPFCRGKCAYCAFYSEPKRTDESVQGYLDKLFEDFSPYRGTCLESLYIGGGTPTLLKPDEMRRLFDGIRNTFTFASGGEISMECNPETLTEEKACIMGTLVNRVSMGVQSFSKNILRTLGRSSLDTDAPEKALELLRKNNIQNIGMDFIYAVPGETIQNFRNDLERAVRLDIPHISAYSLTVEEGSSLARRAKKTLVPDDFSDDCWDLSGNFLKESGLPRYEISNYAKPGFECRHNQNVWHGKPYLGFGPAACSFDGTDRKTNVPDLARWLAGEMPETDRITKDARAREIFVMGLRTVRGWTEREFADVADGKKIDFPELKKLIGENLLERTENEIFPTENGLRFWDSLAEELILFSK